MLEETDLSQVELSGGNIHLESTFWLYDQKKVMYNELAQVRCLTPKQIADRLWRAKEHRKKLYYNGQTVVVGAWVTRRRISMISPQEWKMLKIIKNPINVEYNFI